MSPRAFEPLDVEHVLSRLTIDEKTRLLAGIGWWQTFAVERLGVPSIRLTDGPNGARGTKFFEGVPAACFPASTGLASSWDTPLLEQVGKAIALDCKDKGAHILLGPTVNIQRSPLGGRGFESYSEDPLLSGLMARSFIKGLQFEGVAATIKHYVTNDSEFERNSMSSEVSTRALREIYLRPFELVCRDTDSPAWAVMTAYNRVNGAYLLDTILRKQWGWDGMIMSDWFGTYSADASIKAGLDLEMPGPPLWRASALQRCVVAQKVKVSEIDERVRKILGLINKVAASGIPENADETGKPTEKTVKLLRKAAGHANVLLKNENNVLPLSAADIKSIAVIGPNADAPVYSGGGAANLRPYHHITSLGGIRAALSESGNDVKVQHVIGALAHKETPLLGTSHLKTKDGKPGFDIEWFHEDPIKNPTAKRVHYSHGTNSTSVFMDNLPEVSNLSTTCWATISTTYTPEVSGKYEFGATAVGLVDMYINGTKIIDNTTKPVLGAPFFGSGSREVLGSITLEANQRTKVVLQFASLPIAQGKGFLQSESALLEWRGACRFGGGRVFTEDEGIKEAVEAAQQADTAVIVIGLNNDWECEGHDRSDMSLPGATNRLVSAVLKANKRSIVVNISGTPVSMPWASEASTVIQSFYSGGEAGNGLADVLFGKLNPSSKLPLTFPIVNEDAPSYLNFPGQNGKVHYVEGVFVGYRHYQTFNKNVLFPFGFGLSYTQFEYSDLTISGTIGPKSIVEAAVTVKNAGRFAGQEAVQVYVRDVASRLDRPSKELKGFGKTSIIEPGKTETITVILDRYAFAYFDDWAEDGQDGDGRWVAEAGDFEIIVAASSVDERQKAMIHLEQSFTWI
ncbi:putative beta-glucosidase precursor [Ceratobasidium sp. AG-I]|nr:putative beta-glucosidase precursor [Ceratobasidium sp. AG-I]